jgi:hypothetical protein
VSFDDWFDPQDTSELEINPNFIDALGLSMGFNEEEKVYRKGLHALPKVSVHTSVLQLNTNTSQLVRGMPRSYMQSNLIQVILLYSILKECCGLVQANRTSHALMAEI